MCEDSAADPGASTQPYTICENELFSSMRVPLLNPSNPRNEAFLFCFAKEIAMRFPDLQICPGCRYNSCSQAHHVDCSTIENAHTLRKEEFSPDKERVIARFQKLLEKLGLSPTDNEEVDLLMSKCNDPWKNLVVNCILYDFENFPDEWIEYI